MPNLHWVNCVEFLDLALLFVKIHNDWFVIGLTEACYEVVVLRHDDAVNGSHGVGHVVEELTPEPVAVWADRVDVSVRVLGGSEVAGVCYSTDEDIIAARVDIHGVDKFLLKPTSEDGEFLISAGCISES